MEKQFNNWALTHFLRLSIFNIILILLFLLRSVGYFYPFFEITTNVAVISGLILSIFLLGANSRVLFIVTTIFWLLALFFKVVGVEIWAERTSVYVFESLFLGVLLLLWESVRSNNRKE